MEFYEKTKNQQGMSKHIFYIDRIIENPDDEDVWVIYQTENHIE